LGILTVGIVTTPFSYEGKKRQMQAEEGIRTMKEYVDTLLVISNDKLRHQFGNLKMKEAFNRADNVLATAAKCITDVINSTGQINVDFADVCTVMRNGGVAILGSAACGGENRAQKTIEEALASPLLNDNDIRGAKWILININSSEGDHEFTMDEVEIIQNYLLSHAGEGTDVILGMGYDNSLDDKIGITLIATGFEHKDPFDKPQQKSEQPKKDERIILTLGSETAPTPAMKAKPEVVVDKVEPVAQQLPVVPHPAPEESTEIVFFTINEDSKNTVDNKTNKFDKLDLEERTEWLLSQHPTMVQQPLTDKPLQQSNAIENNPLSPAASGGYLAKPSNIYAEPPSVDKSPRPVNHPSFHTEVKPGKEEEPSPELQLVFKEEIPAADEPLAHQTQEIVKASVSAEEPAMQDEVENQKRRAAERIQKLRNLSFNINAADPNNEFETVPAYIRRNLELYNTVSHVENFYSNYEVRTDEDNTGSISTINTFLDGKKPD
jgi:cell division protein FtsZ